MDEGSKDPQDRDRKPANPLDGMSPTARRHARRREERLEEIREQVDDGSLVIRKMTPEERAKYPPRPKGSKRRGRKGA